ASAGADVAQPSDAKVLLDRLMAEHRRGVLRKAAIHLRRNFASSDDFLRLMSPRLVGAPSSQPQVRDFSLLHPNDADDEFEVGKDGHEPVLMDLQRSVPWSIRRQEASHI